MVFFYALMALNTIMLITETPVSDTLPVSLNEAKAHLRVDFTTDDAYISSLIGVATQLAERETNIHLRPFNCTMDLEGFPIYPNRIRVPRAPLGTVTSITYYNTQNTPATLDPSWYIVFTPAHQYGEIAAAKWYFPPCWPRPDAATVTFTSGYIVCPLIAKQAILLMVGEWYENRENSPEALLKTLPLGVDRLLDQIRLL